jgi:hypothetical protein
VKDREYLFQPDMSRAVSDPKINLTAPLQDALNVQGEHQLHQAQQAAVNGTPVATVQPQTPTSAQQMRTPVPNGNAIRPPSAPQGISPQTPARPPQSSQQQQQVAALLLQQQLIQTKAQQPAAMNGVTHSSPSQNPPQPQPQSSPNTAISQPMTNGTAAPVSSFVPVQLNGTNGVTPSPPKATPNGIYHPSPSSSPLPPTAGMVGNDAGTIVRVSTPIRKPTMPMQNGGPMQINGFQPLPSNQHPGFPGANAMAGMYNNLQGMKMLNQQQMMQQYQQQFQGHLTPHQVQQQQHFQQQQQQLQQQQQIQQQFHMMQMQHPGGMGNSMAQGHYGDPMAQNQHAQMNMQQNPGMYNQNMFQMGMAPGVNNSALNMTMQNMNLQLGPQNMALRLPPNRMQQTNISRPATSMGSDYGMGMSNGSSPMMQAMQNMGMGNQQMAAAMGRAPSTPLSLRGGGLMPNGGMMMGRSPAAMQSPMMRPTSAASMHSNLGMQMQPGPSLPVSLQGSPAGMQQAPPTPHMRQQPVPGL